MRPCLVIAALLALAPAAPAPAARADVEPLPPPAFAVPRDGALVPASSWPAATPFEMVDFTVYASAPFLLAGPFEVEVATSSKPDPDGTLPDAAVVERLTATPRAGFTGIFSARVDVGAQWAGTPGTYWWQATFRRTDPAAGCDPCVYGTPVHRLVLGPPEPAAASPGASPRPGSAPAAGGGGASYLDVAPLTRGAARRAARATIRRRIGERPRRLRTRCAFPTPFDATCRSAWRDQSFRYRGRMFVWSGAGGIGASFTGTRTLRGCHRAARRCATPVRWLP